MSHDPELDFLAGLADPNTAEAAWSAFVERFSPLLLKVAGRFGSDRDDVLDYYLHVCEHLVEDGYHRLRAFRDGGARRFPAWLTAIARNLCVDELRARRGRRRLPAAIARLEEIDRAVFEALYWEGWGVEAAWQHLAGKHPGLDLARVLLAVDRIECCLRPYQLAELAAGGGVRAEPAGSALLVAVADQRPDPETAFLTGERLAALETQLAALPADDRLLLRLRFEQGLTLAEAASILGAGDFRRAHEQLARVLDRLRAALIERGMS